MFATFQNVGDDLSSFEKEKIKKPKICPDIPSWEYEALDFDPCKIKVKNVSEERINYRGESIQPPFSYPCAENVKDVSDNDLEDILLKLPLRNPVDFIAGNIHSFAQEWEDLRCDNEVKSWIKDGVDVKKYFRKFKGNFKGKAFDSIEPPLAYFPNSTSCRQFGHFIASTLRERLENGSISVYGKVGDSDVPRLVLPLTVEPSKPRVCHDERFLNLWVVDRAFKLDTLKEVPALISRNMFMTSVDDKSGYDHVLLTKESRTFFGFQFGGYIFVYNTIPFGFKLSAYIYQKLGQVATGHCRYLGVPCLQYIDDRLIGELLGNTCTSLGQGNRLAALRALYIVCEVLTRLGYFLALLKCKFEPCRILKFLGLLILSAKLAFQLPVEKIRRFVELRESILNSDKVDIKTLQKFAGKCVSFVLAVPAARLYTREVNIAISVLSKRSSSLPLVGGLREEILFWRFLDTWEGFMPWRSQKHLQINIASDSSLYKWGALIENDTSNAFGDMWSDGDKRPIHLKEAEALLNALKSVSDKIKDHRVDGFVDSQALIGVWKNEGSRNSEFNDIVKAIFKFTQECNIDLRLHYIPSNENLADQPSRSLTLQDSRLSESSWEKVQNLFGPHSVDLMSLDSNAMKDLEGNALRHFTPFPSPKSDGINLFSQDLSKEENPYVFPPFSFISPVVTYLQESGVSCCTVVIPDMYPRPVWWPVVWAKVTKFFVLGESKEKGILEIPSTKGYISDSKGLTWRLYVCKLLFSL